MIFEPGGALSEAIEGYESRPQQTAMSAEVSKAFGREGIALIEAGTGTGKSFAYLVPAILAAHHEGKRTVISTHTINLQQQLVKKDLPILLKALQMDVEAVLVKGMSNYLCHRRFEDAFEEKGALSLDHVGQMEQIRGWSEETEDGSLSDLDFLPDRPVWEKVSVEFDACTQRRCPHFKKCFLFDARKRAEEADILVVNHHLLLADMALKETGADGILPKYDYVVVDEAHHLEDVATEVWAQRLSRSELVRVLGRLISDKQDGKFKLLRKRLLKAFPDGEASNVLPRLELDLPSGKRQLVTLANEVFHELSDFFSPAKGGELSKGRLNADHLTHPRWSELAEKVGELDEDLKAYIQSLRSLQADVKRLDKENEKLQSVCFDVEVIANRLERFSDELSNFMQHPVEEGKVKWVENGLSGRFANVQLVAASLEVAPLLAERLFTRAQGVVLTSATLTTAGNFKFLRQRLGLTPELLDDKKVTESIYDSPFAFEEQALLLVPQNIPNPQAGNFIEQASKCILNGVKASKGNAFVLFTSFRMLDQCHSLLKQQIEELGYPVLRQGEMARQPLLERFREEDQSVLFGTSSFWEGVDVAGEALRCVIIAKLPFQVPTEPMIQARMEAIEAEGGSSFMQYSVPQAIVKFKQGFGRLIRNQKDRGCILCLDSRLLTKNYGQLFLKSLPSCKQSFPSLEALSLEMSQFYS